MTSSKKKPPASKKRQPAEYEVGYKKPPIDTRFKPGQSGNPVGRAKSSTPGLTKREFYRIVQEEAERPITGAKGDLPTVVALVRSVLVHGVKGSSASQKLGSELIEKAEKANPSPEKPFDWSVYTDEEVDTLARLFGKQNGAGDD